MNAYEIQQFSQSIAWHPLVAIGGLMILISIARKMDLNYKELIQSSNNEESPLDKTLLITKETENIN